MKKNIFLMLIGYMMKNTVVFLIRLGYALFILFTVINIMTNNLNLFINIIVPAVIFFIGVIFVCCGVIVLINYSIEFINTILNKSNQI